jgi:hypothetical protein
VDIGGRMTGIAIMKGFIKCRAASPHAAAFPYKIMIKIWAHARGHRDDSPVYTAILSEFYKVGGAGGRPRPTFKNNMPLILPNN